MSRNVRTSAAGRRKRRSLRRVLMAVVAILFAVVVVLPVALLSLYRIPAIHPVSTLMLASLLSGKGYERRWVPIDEVAPVLVNSVMMSEDARFCIHHGVDWGELNGVIDDAMDGEATRGASTIPMQTVKNLFLWSSRSYVRKAVEIPLAYVADFILGKRRLMEIYLNIAEWGPGIYGIEAAAEHAFRRHAADLTDWEAALLAVTLPNPEVRNPARPGRGLVRLARVIRERARKAGAYVGCVK